MKPDQVLPRGWGDVQLLNYHLQSSKLLGTNSNSGESPEYQIQLQSSTPTPLQLRSYNSWPNSISNSILHVELNQ